MATLHSQRKSISFDVFTFLDGNITAVQPTALSAIFFTQLSIFRKMEKFVNFGPKIPVGRLLRRTRICSEMFASALIGYR